MLINKGTTGHFATMCYGCGKLIDCRQDYIEVACDGRYWDFHSERCINEAFDTSKQQHVKEDHDGE